MKVFRGLLLAVLLAAAGCDVSSLPGSIERGAPVSGAAPARPNVLVILADDLGYSDLGVFGSEIATPNIDRLAAEGRILTNMHVTPLCATTRASLLTGVDHHRVGVGTLSEMGPLLYPGQADYAGELNHNAPTLAALLRDAGYHTYMVGKWHLGGDGPNAFGFEHAFSYDYPTGSGSNYAGAGEPGVKPHYEDGLEAQLPADFYSSDYYTQKLLQYLDGGAVDHRPFFAYLAYRAVHYPLQAPDAYLDLYRGRYDAGYEAVRNARIEKQKKLGLIPQDFTPHPGTDTRMYRWGKPGRESNEPWDELNEDERRSEARLMEVFAGMLTNLDDNVGRVVSYLKQTGRYDNTIIVFLSDNGSDGVGSTVPGLGAVVNANADNSLENYGKPGSFLFLSSRWAEVSSAPYRLFKGYTSEGGLRSPTIVRIPGQVRWLPAIDAMATLYDLAPTILEATGAEAPRAAGAMALEGRSLLPLLRGQTVAIHAPDEVFAGEVNDIRYVRRGPWKLTRFTNWAVPSNGYFLDTAWQLFNLEQDGGETLDVATVNPLVTEELRAEWRAYVERVGVKQPAFPPLLAPIDD